MMMGPLRNAFTAAAAAACTASFLCMDCNPSLWIADKWIHSTSRPSSHFHNQRIWIVGASSGIGEELAYQLAAPSSSSSATTAKFPIHLILSSRNQQKLERVADKCRNSNPHCTVTVLPVDVCQEQDLIAAVQQLAESEIADRPIDTVVLNAGGGHLSPALETSSETARTVFHSNALWPMILTPLLFEYNLFRQSCRPHLVVTSSIAAVMPVPLSATYAAAKHALQGYFESLAAERPDLLIHTVLPGPVDTDFHQNSRSRETRETSVVTGNGSTSSKLKMSVQRCARLIYTTMLLRHSTHSWIVQQPVLLALYLQQWAPGLMQYVYGMIGPKRVAMFRAGLDLYDPASLSKLRQLERRGSVDSQDT